MVLISNYKRHNSYETQKIITLTVLLDLQILPLLEIEEQGVKILQKQFVPTIQLFVDVKRSIDNIPESQMADTNIPLLQLAEVTSIAY